MAKFKYKIMDQQNKNRSGTIEAANMEAARSRLRDEGYTILTLTESKSMEDAAWNVQFGSGVNLKEMSVFCRQFCSLLEAGITVVNALSMLVQQTANKNLQKALKNVQNNVEKGETLASAMKLENKVFPELLINMVSAGEATGNLDKAFGRITQQLEKDSKLKAMLRGAMIYPIIILVVAVGVVFVMLLMVIPNFEDMLSSMDMELPAITKFVVAASNGMKANVVPIMLVLILVVVVFFIFKASEAGKVFFSRMALMIPLFKDLAIKSASAKLGRTLATLLQSGVPLPEAVEIVADTIPNKIVQRSMRDAKSEIMRGIPLSDPLRRSQIFPPMVYHMVGIGEETGTTDQMLDKIADYYEDEVEEATKALTTVMEPAMILFLAGIVGSVIMAVLMPMMSMYQGLDKETGG